MLLSVPLFVLISISSVFSQCQQGCANVVNPCGSSSYCGYYPQQSQFNYCQNFPCFSQWNYPQIQNSRIVQQQQQQQQKVIPYPYYYQRPQYNINKQINDQYIQTLQTIPNNYHQTQQYIQNDPYANVPVEIIDEEDAPTVQNSTGIHHQTQDEYANIPVEIVDDNSYSSSSSSNIFKSNLPVLPKTNSFTTYQVSGGQYTGGNTVQVKPFQTTITRVLKPSDNNPSIDINVVNGEVVDDNTATTITSVDLVEDDHKSEEADETVEPVNSWLG